MVEQLPMSIDGAGVDACDDTSGAGSGASSAPYALDAYPEPQHLSIDLDA